MPRTPGAVWLGSAASEWAPGPCTLRRAHALSVPRGTATVRLSAVLVRLLCSANLQPSAGSSLPFLGEWMELGSA